MANTGGSRPMDMIKTIIAKAIQDVILPVSVIERMKRDPELGVADLEIHVISPVETMLRVKTESQGVRYFRVKISEML